MNRDFPLSEIEHQGAVCMQYKDILCSLSYVVNVVASSVLTFRMGEHLSVHIQWLSTRTMCEVLMDTLCNMSEWPILDVWNVEHLDFTICESRSNAAALNLRANQTQLESVN